MIRNSTNDILIKPKMSSSTRLVIIASAILLSLLVVYFAYSFGLRASSSVAVQQGDKQGLATIGQLKQSIQTLEDDLDAALDRAAFAERQQQIQEEAYKQMSQAYASSEEKNRYLGSRLDFYLSIISPQGGKPGPAIQGLELTVDNSVEGQSDLVFDVTLVQAIKHKTHVTGSLTVTLIVGEDVVQKWPVNAGRSVNYQYFQRISGVFESVSSIDDAKIDIVLSLRDGTIIEKTFPIVEEQLINAVEAAG